MVMKSRWIMLTALLVAQSGCCVWSTTVNQNQSTPAEAKLVTEPETGRRYWLYVPSRYDPAEAWPLVVTLHGAGPCDSSEDQIREWKHLAEQRGLIVAAPALNSASLTRMRWDSWRDAWRDELRGDEQAVLAVIDHVVSTHTIADVAPPAGAAAPATQPAQVRRHILLTGFLEGGYALYAVGLKHGGRFSALIARDCHFDSEEIGADIISEETTLTPMLIGNGKDGSMAVAGSLFGRGQAWEAYGFLRDKGCTLAERKEYRGGQIRRPQRAYEFWRVHLPKALRR